MSRDGAWRRRRLADARLYLCVDRRGEHDDLASLLEAVLAAGVDLVQLRDKAADADELRAASVVFREAAERHDALFVLNDNPSLAAEVHADGVHVGQDDPTPAEARMLLGAERLVGLSTHSEEQVSEAVTSDCDYFAVGPVHATPTKQGRRPAGLAPVHRAAAVAGERPWFVTGGMDRHSAPEVLAAGARRLVVVRAITEAPDPAAAARELSGLLRAG